MVTLALTGAPSLLTWEAYKATKAAGGALGALLGAAEATALAAIALKTAAVLGAGAGGFMIGQAILAQLAPESTMPDMGEYYEVGTTQQQVRFKFDYTVDGNPVFTGQYSQFLIAPVKGIFFKVVDGGSLWFVFDGNGDQQNITFTSNKAEGTQLRIIEFELANGTKVPPTKRLPSYVPTRPDSPTFAPPATIPIPGVPDFPITPIAVPDTGNDEPAEGGERNPGVVVQVPQTGTQVRFTPGGVQITNYNAPNREPFRVPPINLPPGGKASTPECCPKESPDPEEPNLDEIICRLKALQDEILDDGWDGVSGQTPIAQSGFYEELDGGFFRVQMNLVDRPKNAKIQPSTDPVPDVIYCGWFSWVVNGFPTERLPLHFDDQNFLAPPDVTGFMYQYYAAHTGWAQWTRRTKREYVDFCVPADAS